MVKLEASVQCHIINPPVVVLSLLTNQKSKKMNSEARAALAQLLLECILVAKFNFEPQDRQTVKRAY